MNIYYGATRIKRTGVGRGFPSPGQVSTPHLQRPRGRTLRLRDRRRGKRIVRGVGSKGTSKKRKKKG